MDSNANTSDMKSARRLDIKAIYDKIYGIGGESMSFSAGPH